MKKYYKNQNMLTKGFFLYILCSIQCLFLLRAIIRIAERDSFPHGPQRE